MRKKGRREREVERGMEGTRRAAEEAQAVQLKERRTKRGSGNERGSENENGVERKRERGGERATEAEATTPSQQGAADAHEATATPPGTDDVECV